MIDDMNGEIYVEPPFQAIIISPEPVDPEPDFIQIVPEPAAPEPETVSPAEIIPAEKLPPAPAQLEQDTVELLPEAIFDSGADMEAGPVFDSESGFISIAGMGELLQHLETLEEAAAHPMLTTSFQEYTVTEGLLLALLLSVFISACVKMLKGGFAWLR